MKRHEHRGIEPADHGCAVFKRKILIALTGQSDADAATLDQLVPKIAREGERQVFFGNLTGDASSARIAPSMARVDHHDRTDLRRGRPVNAVVGGRGRSSVRLPWPGASAEAAPLRLDATAMPSAATTSNAAAAPAKVVRFATEKFTKLPQAVEQQLLITLEWLMRNWLLARSQAEYLYVYDAVPHQLLRRDRGC